MLERTFKLLKGIQPGTFVPDENVVYDEDEIMQLGAALSQLLYAPSQIRKKLQTMGVSIVPSNFYSQIPNVSDIEREFERQNQEGEFHHIFDRRVLHENLSAISEYSHEFDPSDDDLNDGKFFWNNSQFSYSDAMSYYCMIRYFKPMTIIEIGAGFSTLVAIKACEKNGRGKIICIEPFPRQFLIGNSAIELIHSTIQDFGFEYFNAVMSDGDFLFIDSTHTVKFGSDCVHIYLKILPFLNKSLLIHAHDIFLPKTIGLPSMRDHQIYWTEQELLCAYLTNNNRADVFYSSSANFIYHTTVLEALMHGRWGAGGSSIWFSQHNG